MSEFIDSLKNDHIIILVLLRKLKNKNLTLEERHAYFLTVKTIVNKHFELEDVKLYPEMIKMATETNNANKTVEEFTVGLDKIGTIITSFFSKYDRDLSSLNQNSDFNKIIKLLEVRISKEEKSLYPLYNKLIQK